jgi:tetratricopeptide (TPR) repeat protein
MNKLPLQDQRHLDAAEGWLGLGDHLAANEEIDQISLALRIHPFVLEIRYKIYAEAKRWDAAIETARSVAKSMPENPWGYFHLAYSLHELKQTQEAYDILRPVVDKFPDHCLMRYNLACYSCQLGKLKEAMRWLEKAIDLAGDMDVRGMALDDPDLGPLRAKIRAI